MSSLDDLLGKVRSCTLCETQLPHGIRPILQASGTARVLIAGQAPGKKVHETGTPFDDASGDRLREWLGIDKALFYDNTKIAILPMGFCYPGTGKSGDLAPRKECAPAWRQPLLDMLPNIKLTLVIGNYAMKWHLGGLQKSNLTATVQHWQAYQRLGVFPLPHPSPRNNIWLAKNKWFEGEVLPSLRAQVAKVLAYPPKFLVRENRKAFVGSRAVYHSIRKCTIRCTSTGVHVSLDQLMLVCCGSRND